MGLTHGFIESLAKKAIGSAYDRLDSKSVENLEPWTSAKDSPKNQKIFIR